MSSDASEFEPSFSYREAEAESEQPKLQHVEPELFQFLVDASTRQREEASSRLDRFLRAGNVRGALEEWFGGPIEGLDSERIIRRLNQAVAYIDQAVNSQLNAILHHPKFQKLEASWRGLHYLADQAYEIGDPSIQIRVLNASWRDLERDFERAVEFDQSLLFKRVYEEELGTPGGEPFGVLIADYEVHPITSAEHPHDDMAVVRSLAKVGAAAFCPVITNASPTMFGMDTFKGLEHHVDHARTQDQKTFLRWHSLRDDPDSRFIGLALPRVLMRLPYADIGSRVDGFCFQEDVAGADASKYLWGGAAFALGEVLIRSFSQAGWLADIRGLQRDLERGGLVSRLPVHSFSTDKRGVATKSSTDVVVTEELEKQLSDLGFLPLCHCQHTEYSAFLSSQSIQKPVKYDRNAATVNAQISSMLQYMFCASRFAHYIKVIGRDKIGGFLEVGELQHYLDQWIVNYVTPDTSASSETKARRPLREAKVRVHAVPGKPGAYFCTMHLAPHYELDTMNASIELKAELAPGKAAV